MSIDAQKVALEQKTENDQYAALRSGLEQRLAALKASGIDETEAIHKAQADLEALELTHQAKLTEIATKGATDRSKLEVQSITEQMKQLSGEIGSLLEPISEDSIRYFLESCKALNRLAKHSGRWRSIWASRSPKVA